MMLRSRRPSTLRAARILVALLAATAWTNAQAMACCWISQNAAESTEIAAEAGNDPIHASCHGPAANRDEAESSPASGAPDSSCDAFGDSSARLSDCCETFSPAESFSPAPSFEASPTRDFLAHSPSAASTASVFPNAQDAAPPGAPPRFLSERLLI